MQSTRYITFIISFRSPSFRTTAGGLWRGRKESRRVTDLICQRSGLLGAVRRALGLDNFVFVPRGRGGESGLVT